MIWINETSPCSASVIVHEKAISDANLLASDIAVILRFVRLLCADDGAIIVTDDNSPLELE